MAQQQITEQEFDQLFISNRSLLDVRAPVEFNKGAFEYSCNLPLMNDNERERVGTCYKQQGQQAAISLGHSLVNGKIKQARVDAWLDYINAQPEAYLYCFRGGLRSQLSQAWIQEAGADIPYIQGGYKALRQHLISKLEQDYQPQMLILSGSTGSGKTDFLLQRSEAVDLEGAANHRGSSFGRQVTSQPTQINFENKLASELMKHQARGLNCLLLEDESYLIGRNAIPKPFFTQMQQANLVIITEEKQTRLERLLKEYVHNMHQGLVNLHGEELGLQHYSDYLHQSMGAIKKRLGGKLHDELQTLISAAINHQSRTDDTSAHLEWINALLEHYYDPMYQYQLGRKHGKVIFSGDHQAMHQWLDDLNQTPQIQTP